MGIRSLVWSSLAPLGAEQELHGSQVTAAKKEGGLWQKTVATTGCRKPSLKVTDDALHPGQNSDLSGLVCYWVSKIPSFQVWCRQLS